MMSGEDMAQYMLILSGLYGVRLFTLSSRDEGMVVFRAYSEGLDGIISVTRFGWLYCNCETIKGIWYDSRTKSEAAKGGGGCITGTECL